MSVQPLHAFPVMAFELRLQRLLSLLLCIFAVFAAIATAFAAVPRIQVRGASRLDVHSSGPSSSIQISGALRDELGVAIPNTKFLISALGPQFSPVPWNEIYPCGTKTDSSTPQLQHLGLTDDTGAFCFQASLSQNNATIRVEYAGDLLHDGTRADVLWDAAQRAAVLSFSPRPERIDLDLPQHLLTARVAVDKAASPSGLVISLEDHSGQPLAQSTTDINGLANFEVSSKSLSGPSIGELRLRFAGSTQLAPTTAVTVVTRFARVLLTMRTSMQGDPISGVRQSVSLSTTHGPVLSGMIEARLGTDVVGVAPVQNGNAALLIAFSPVRNRTNESIDVRFISDAPYYQAQAPQVLQLQISRPSLALRVIPVVIAIGLAFWILRGWWRPKRLERPSKEIAKPAGLPSLNVVAQAQSRGSWKGKVVDAYDSSPIDGARLRVISPSFADVDVVVECVADAAGDFDFRVHSYDKQLRLRIESPLHVELDRPLPPPCDLSVALVTRRRALLDRLVAWAKREGKPWDFGPEPTPGYIGRAALAGRHKREDVANWAQKLEEKAFGPSPVLARDEREVRDIEPGPKALR